MGSPPHRDGTHSKATIRRELVFVVFQTQRTYPRTLTTECPTFGRRVAQALYISFRTSVEGEPIVQMLKRYLGCARLSARCAPDVVHSRIGRPFGAFGRRSVRDPTAPRSRYTKR